ncbi:MAG: DUF1501 domain-containing protein [Polyangiaceae bacterium]
MNLSRRRVLEGLFATGGLGLRALATGLPLGFLLGERHAAAASPADAQFLILATSAAGDPFNANCPGSYVLGAENNPHLELGPTEVRLGAASVKAAQCWANLPEGLRARLCFFHHRTDTNAHPEHSKVMTLHGAAKLPSGNGQEMIASVFASELAQSLGAIQTEPLPLGKELITYEGRALNNIPPLSLKGLFEQADNPLASLASLRDQSLDALNGELKAHGTRAQRQFLDRFALGREQARQLGGDLAGLLQRLPVDAEEKNSAADQVIAAVALIKLRVAPVVTIHLPFGGDNHGDSDLSTERDQTLASVAALGNLWTELTAQGLQESVTFASLNVFGRTLERNGSGGRNHNQNHHVMALFGKHIKPGVIGGVAATNHGFSALPIDSKTGKGHERGDIAPSASLAAAARTLGHALGISQDRLDFRMGAGALVQAALT